MHPLRHRPAAIPVVLDRINPSDRFVIIKLMLIVEPYHSLHGIVGRAGAYSLPGDKSLSHRAALFAAMAEGKSRIENFLVSGVTEAMLDALTGLGVEWQLVGNTLTVTGRGFRGLQTPAAAIDCGNSATTLRLLAGALAGGGVAAELTGTPGLCKRPMGRMVEPLQRMGVPIQASPQSTAPLVLAARWLDHPLKAIDIKLPVASAQVKSALLLAALAADGSTTLREPGPSRDHTERMLRSMGVVVQSWTEPGGVYATKIMGIGRNIESLNLQPLTLTLPCDISSAAFLIVASLITPGSDLIIQGVGLNPTRTGLIDALQMMGADLQVLPGPEQAGEPCGDLIVRASTLHAVEISGNLVVRMIDEFPVFTVAAAFATGTTVVRNAEELRYKESDRIGVLGAELRKLGVELHERPDGFSLAGGLPLHGATVDPHGDHRLAMALTVAGLAAKTEVTIEAAEIITESFPEFAPILLNLGAKLIFIGD